MTPPPVIEMPSRPTSARPDAARPARGPVVAYDFRRPTKVSREHVRVLQMAFETMARRLTTLLTSGLRVVCTVEVGEISQRSYDDYVAGLQAPSVTVPLGLAPLPGSGTLHFSLPVALAAIDHLLGGPGGSQRQRTLTDIEVSVLRGLLDQISGVLRYALEPVAALECIPGSVEYNPQFVQAAGAADAVIVGEFELRIGAEVSPLLISLPLSPLLPILDSLRPRDAALDADANRVLADLLGARMAEVPLDVSLEFEPVLLTPERILTLEVGDVITLRHPVGAPLTVHAGGARYARAVAGRTGNQLAALVTQGPDSFAKELQ